MMNLFFIWLTLSTTASLVHKQRPYNEAAVVKNKVTEFKRNNTKQTRNLSIWSSSLDISL